MILSHFTIDDQRVAPWKHNHVDTAGDKKSFTAILWNFWVQSKTSFWRSFNQFLSDFSGRAWAWPLSWRTAVLPWTPTCRHLPVDLHGIPQDFFRQTVALQLVENKTLRMAENLHIDFVTSATCIHVKYHISCWGCLSPQLKGFYFKFHCFTVLAQI